MVALTGILADGKETICPTTACDIPTNDDQISTVGTESERRRTYKKYKILVVSCMVIVALLLAAVLIGVYFVMSSTQKILHQYHTQITDGSESNRTLSRQDTTVYDNIVEQHVVTGDRDMWQLIDYSRELVIMKVKTGSELVSEICYVTPLNRSAVQIYPESSPIDPALAPTGEVEGLVHVQYESMGHSISDHSMFGVKGQQFCEGLSAYWVLPTYENSGSSGLRVTETHDNSTLLRHKRQVVRPPYPYWPCSTFYCYNVYYPGDNKPYLKCDRVPCGYVPSSQTVQGTTSRPFTAFDPSANRTTLLPDIPTSSTTTSTTTSTSTSTSTTTSTSTSSSTTRSTTTTTTPSTTILITPSSSSSSSSSTTRTSSSTSRTSTSTQTTIISSPTATIFISSPTSKPATVSSTLPSTTTRRGAVTSTSTARPSSSTTRSGQQVENSSTTITIIISSPGSSTTTRRSTSHTTSISLPSSSPTRISVSSGSSTTLIPCVPTPIH